MDPAILRESIRGIGKEINRRTWRICGIIVKYKGSVRPFVKPYPDKESLINQALKLRREVLRLYAIREQLRQIERELINPFVYDLRRTIKRSTLAKEAVGDNEQG